MDLQHMLPIAQTAVIAACRLCRSVAAKRPDALTKADRSPVTIADFGSQAILIHSLKEAFPDIPVAAEESADALRDAQDGPLAQRILDEVQALAPGLTWEATLDLIDGGGHAGGPQGAFWTIDPIDGTKGFLRGDQYAIAVALVRDGEVRMGVLGCPELPVRAGRPGAARGCLFSAVHDRGATMRTLDTGEVFPIQVNRVEDPAQASFCESVEAAHQAHDQSARVAQRLGVVAPPFRIDSQCKYAAIGRGDASIYLRLPSSPTYQEKIWDHAAGSILVTEAGGRVTDSEGRPLDFSQGRTLRRNQGVIATNGRIHDEVIRAVQTAAAS